MRNVAIIALLLVARVAFGDAKSDADKLFEEGVALREQGKVAEACAKFEAAMKKDERAIGTLLNLALCAERDGRVATAVKLFGEARDRASEQDMDAQKQAAIDHLGKLAPLVPHLTIKLAKPLPGMKILVDDRIVAQDALVELPIDPGKRTVSVSAPDHLPFETTVEIVQAKPASLDVPELKTSVVVTVKSSRKTIGKIATIAGAAVFAVGAGLAVYAKTSYDKQFDAHTNAAGEMYFPCRSDGTCDPEGQKATERARTFGTIATVVGGVGLAAAGVGVALWLTAPSASSASSAEEHAMIVPIVGPDQLGVATMLRW